MPYICVSNNKIFQCGLKPGTIQNKPCTIMCVFVFVNMLLNQIHWWVLRVKWKRIRYSWAVIIWHESYPPWYAIPSELRICFSHLRRLIETACLVFSHGLKHSLPLNDAILASTKTLWIVKVICKLFCTTGKTAFMEFQTMPAQQRFRFPF